MSSASSRLVAGRTGVRRAIDQYLNRAEPRKPALFGVQWIVYDARYLFCGGEAAKIIQA